jgi:hypothetical protein
MPRPPCWTPLLKSARTIGEHPAFYHLLTALMVLLPVGWISTISNSGVRNSAPYSYFNLMGRGNLGQRSKAVRSSSRVTPRWRKADSNSQSHRTE